MDETDLKTIEDHLDQAQSLWFQGKPKQALDGYASVVDALPHDAPIEYVFRAKRDYALCLREVGEIDKALSHYPELEALCKQGDIDPTIVLRHWAIALEHKRDFAEARRLYEKIKPDHRTPQLDRLRWEHAVGLLNWSEGRLTEASKNLAAAAAVMPRDPKDAANYLPVLGNDALLSVYLGNTARAYRLVSRMLEIRQQVEAIPLAGETNLAIVQAALAHRRQDYAQEARILKDCVDWLEANDPEVWMHKLDLVGRFVAASCRAGPSDEAISYLSGVCDRAPVHLAWIGAIMLAKLQLEAGDPDGARRNAVIVLASVVGSGPAEAELEIVAILADLAHLSGRVDAAILLGKLSLGYLAQMTHTLEGPELRQIIEDSDKLVQQTTANLRSAGRFQEAVVLEDLFDRVRRYALVLRRPASQALATQAVPFDQDEMQAQADWLSWRQELATLRETGAREDVMARSEDMIAALLKFKTSSGLAHRKTTVPPPAPGNVRVSLVAAGDVCELQYQWSDKTRTVRTAISSSAFFNEVAALRDAVSDPTAWRPPAATLYRHIIAPIEADLDRIDCLEIDASGVLGRIPMALLTDGAVCLVQRVAIRYLVNVDPPMRDPTGRRGLVHCSAFRSGPLARPPRPFADLEGALTPAVPALGTAFTREAIAALLQTRPTYLSVATHLEIEPTRPDISTLLLGDDEPLYLADFAGDQFDLNGLRVALFATCSSGVDDVTNEQDTSLAALVLEKGAEHFVGTLWDISETAAAEFIADFWQALAADPSQDPAMILSGLQSGSAEQAQLPRIAASRAGGIGSPARALAPEGWAAFAVFENCNRLQQTA